MQRALVALLTAVRKLSTSYDVAVIGGMARGVWATPRATMDVDILIGTLDLDSIVARAREMDLAFDPAETAGLASSGMTRLRVAEFPNGPIRLDILSADHPYYVRVLSRVQRLPVLGIEVPVACAEDIIVLKHLADRHQDRADIVAIIAAQGDRLNGRLIAEECTRLQLDPIDALR